MQIGAGGVGLLAFDKLDGITGQGAQGGQRLVQFVGNAGGQLAQHGQFAGLHQIVLGLAQVLFGTDAFADFFLQLLVGTGQVGGALFDLAFQLAISLLQGFTCGQLVTQAAASFVQPQNTGEAEQGEQGGQRRTVIGQLVHRLQAGQHGQPPVGQRQLQRLPQHVARVGQPAQRAPAALVQPVDVAAVAQAAPFFQPQWRQRFAVILPVAVEGILQGLAEGLEGAEFPPRFGGQDDHFILVGHHHHGLVFAPQLFQVFHIDLDHRHANDAAVAGQRLGQIVAGFAAGGAHAEKAAGLAADGIGEIGTEGIVFAQIAVRLPPVAGGAHDTAAVHDVDGAGPGALAQPFQIVIGGLLALAVLRGVQQPLHIG